MAEENRFALKIITPDRVFYENDALMVEFNTAEGEIGVYKSHVPMTVIVRPGILTITEESQTLHAALHAGFAEIRQDKVTILAEVVEWPDEIDVDRAQQALHRAEERLQAQKPDTDVARAQTALQRAMARIEVIH